MSVNYYDDPYSTKRLNLSNAYDEDYFNNKDSIYLFIQSNTKFSKNIYAALCLIANRIEKNNTASLADAINMVNIAASVDLDMDIKAIVVTYLKEHPSGVIADILRSTELMKYIIDSKYPNAIETLSKLGYDDYVQMLINSFNIDWFNKLNNNEYQFVSNKVDTHSVVAYSVANPVMKLFSAATIIDNFENDVYCKIIGDVYNRLTRGSCDYDLIAAIPDTNELGLIINYSTDIGCQFVNKTQQTIAFDYLVWNTINSYFMSTGNSFISLKTLWLLISGDDTKISISPTIEQALINSVSFLMASKCIVNISQLKIAPNIYDRGKTQYTDLISTSDDIIEENLLHAKFDIRMYNNARVICGITIEKSSFLYDFSCALNQMVSIVPADVDKLVIGNNCRRSYNRTIICNYILRWVTLNSYIPTIKKSTIFKAIGIPDIHTVTNTADRINEIPFQRKVWAYIVKAFDTLKNNNMIDDYEAVKSANDESIKFIRNSSSTFKSKHKRARKSSKESREL